MKRSELQERDIVVCDYSWLGRPTVCYVVIGNYMVSFDGDVNCGDRPAGWYWVKNPYIEEEDTLPHECVRVYRAKHITHTFNGDFDNEGIYECLYRKD